MVVLQSLPYGVPSYGRVKEHSDKQIGSPTSARWARVCIGEGAPHRGAGGGDTKGIPKLDETIIFRIALYFQSFKLSLLGVEDTDACHSIALPTRTENSENWQHLVPGAQNPLVFVEQGNHRRKCKGQKSHFRTRY